MKNNTPLNVESPELTRFAIALCSDELRTALEHLARAAEAAATLKSELGMNLDDFQVYCLREFSIPPHLLVALLEYHDSKGSRPHNNRES
jgi:hypothetical protein